MTVSVNKPAILGGQPAITLNHDEICRWPRFDESDKNAVCSVLEDGNVSTHPVIQDLEKAYADYIGRPYALAHCNGTTALMAAFFALGLQPGDEILVPSATFWASVLPMMWFGLVPKFCESETDTLGIDPISMAENITEKTKAVVIVHLWGLPCKMEEILALAKKHDLKIIEDASHAHGAVWQGKKCGRLGDVSVFSLQGDKLSPAGEGGVLLCDRYEYFERAVCLGDITRIINLETPQRRLAATSYGVKTRIAPLSAALGLNQLKKLDTHNEIRNRNHRYLSEFLETIGFNTFLGETDVDRVYFEFIIEYQRSELPLELLLKALEMEGCQVTLPRYPLVHQQPFFQESLFENILRLPGQQSNIDYQGLKLPKTEMSSQNMIRLPNFTGNDNGILAEYRKAFEKVITHSEAITAAFSNE